MATSLKPGKEVALLSVVAGNQPIFSAAVRYGLVVTILMNQKMRALLGEYQHDPQSFVTAPPEDLMSELQDGFEEVSGCVLPRDPRGGKPFRLDEGEDETEIECLISKVNLIDCVSKTDPYEMMLRMGMAYAFALKNELEKSSIRGPFRIIVGADAEGDHPSATVRYHRLRKDQDWLGDDLEAYQDGVMAIDF